MTRPGLDDVLYKKYVYMLFYYRVFGKTEKKYIA